MRNRRLVIGLALVAVLGVFAIAWPLTGYPSLWHWLRDMPERAQPRRSTANR